MEQSLQYQNLLSEVVKKQTIILGPAVALGIARKVSGLKLADDGTVLSIEGDPKKLMEALAAGYMTLSGQISQNILSSILGKYPEIGAEQRGL